MGIDPVHEGGCYYCIYQNGVATYLYRYIKTTKYVDGSTSTTEVYPKQEFFVGQDELRYWTQNGYSA